MRDESSPGRADSASFPTRPAPSLRLAGWLGVALSLLLPLPAQALQPLPLRSIEMAEAVNRRRLLLRDPVLQPVPPVIQRQIDAYALQLRAAMDRVHDCFHGGRHGVPSSLDGLPLPAGWSVAGEVLSCPASTSVATSERITSLWWESPSHRRIVFGRRGATHLGCSWIEGRVGLRQRASTVCLLLRASALQTARLSPN